MKKRMRALAVMAALSLLAAIMPVQKAAAEEASVETVEQELKASSGYVADTLETNISASDYQLSYNDYLDAMMCLKTQDLNENLLQKLDKALNEQLAAYNDTFLNPYNSSGVKSYALAVATLYLEERQADVTNYNGKNLVELLQETFLAEDGVNPYAYNYVKAVMKNEKVENADVTKKIKDGVLSCYVDNATGSGIDYWGVSADNNGQILTVFAEEYKTDADIKSKVDAALAWNKKQADASGAVVSWGAANPDSTALALRAAAQFGAMDDAKGYYDAMAQFKSAKTPGAYTYAGEDSIFSTRDAMLGLLAYRAALQGTDMFAIHHVAVTPQPAEPTKPQEPGTQPLTEAPATQAGQAAASQTATNQAQTTTRTDVPQTGDTAQAAIPMVMMVLAAGAVVVLRSRRNGTQAKHER